MAALDFDGAPQRGQGQNGQYVYWMCMAFPSEETVAAQEINSAAFASDYGRLGTRASRLEIYNNYGPQERSVVVFFPLQVGP